MSDLAALADDLNAAVMDDILDHFYTHPIGEAPPIGEDHGHWQPDWQPHWEPVELPELFDLPCAPLGDAHQDAQDSPLLGGESCGESCGELEEGMYVHGKLVPFPNEAHDMQRLGKGFCVGPHCPGCQPLRGVCHA